MFPPFLRLMLPQWDDGDIILQLTIMLANDVAISRDCLLTVCMWLDHGGRQPETSKNNFSFDVEPITFSHVSAEFFDVCCLMLHQCGHPKAESEVTI
jgi:hypothetical protein